VSVKYVIVFVKSKQNIVFLEYSFFALRPR
jgi:hypothetical protein